MPSFPPHRGTRPHAHGFVTASGRCGEVHWEVPLPDSRMGQGTLWGSPAMLRQLAELAIQAAIQAEEEACWHAHQAATAIPKQGRVA